MRAREQQSGEIYELCSMIIQILKSPPLLPIPSPVVSPDPSFSSASSSRLHSQVTFSQVSPTAFACLFLGICLALMLFGSVIFIIGFILMPWVIGLVVFFHFVGVVSSLSEFWRSFVVSKDVPCKTYSLSNFLH
ncbi:hypothetical protein DITRI_Ditri16bG0148600 [Diplodiscus trichospermus]